MQTDGRHANAFQARASLQQVLADEHAWREIPHCTNEAAKSDVVIGHWTDERVVRRELTAPMSEQHYTVSILLGKATVDCYKNGRLLDRGTGGMGGVQLTAPGEQVTCSFRGANEAIHLFLPSELVESEYGSLRTNASALRLEDPAFRVDPALVPIARSLAATRDDARRDNVVSIDGMVQGILHHVLSRYAHERPGASETHGLSEPRLRRVIDYIDANLAEPVTLHDIARQAGLSRMHFAAQFRLATGRTPHAFLRARRIERAKALLMRGLPIVDVALAVGFQGQAHFTAVFKELDGLSPGRWREHQESLGRA
ncbi:AraC family transcriptional regulator [Paraburkholderia solisilvae]|uniref:HTH-type transcriptional activator RhaR n=1 Tax=Paraburkholderia solisilvae TaxID=624376 RepID=A0A6J5DD59_9BURK|nr:AraC family transcriptional regulator [Paraburkholderia solisilvae]CAB3750746.1 HTH-type transcriptional activator RhaR [Paraburkholderia solisilvae]